MASAIEDAFQDHARPQGWFSEVRTALDHATRKFDPSPVDSGSALVLTARHSRTDYSERINRAQHLISDGETYEVCLTNMLEAEASIDAFAAYRRLRNDNPTPFGAFIRTREASILSSSPERFVSISAEGRVASKPIKGTRPRGDNPKEDESIIAELRESVKDRSENVMIVDLVRHDLGRTAEIGSVAVDVLFAIETYATVHQMVSTVTSRLAAHSSSVACVREAFPPGSMTGAPKHRTMSIIDNLEAGPRGIYSGALGYFSLDGATDFSVAIRTVVYADKRLRYGVGGAIIALSDAEEEFLETTVKAAPLLRLFDITEFPTGGMEVHSESRDVKP